MFYWRACPNNTQVLPLHFWLVFVSFLDVSCLIWHSNFSRLDALFFLSSPLTLALPHPCPWFLSTHGWPSDTASVYPQFRLLLWASDLSKGQLNPYWTFQRHLILSKCKVELTVASQHTAHLECFLSQGVTSSSSYTSQGPGGYLDYLLSLPTHHQFSSISSSRQFSNQLLFSISNKHYPNTSHHHLSAGRLG